MTTTPSDNTAAETTSPFTQAEIAYLRSQRLGRLATVGPDGQPHVVPVGFRYNRQLGTIDIGGHSIARSKKYRDVQRSPLVAFVVDDIVSTQPWTVRGIEIRGEALALTTGGQEMGPGFAPEILRIRPHRIISWGLEGDARAARARSVA